ncbi:MAG TPA: hypothetical protein DHW42_04635 [Candidatus Marinimicrobia bacterium]|nr:hypothetical protein [Candidatus Neomarinimicrobiota bacterium]
MKILKINCYLLFCFLFIAACTREPALPDFATIPWIESYGYQTSEIFPVINSSAVPGPQIKVVVNHKSQYLLLDFNAIDLILRENIFKNANFEPQRMSNRIAETGEMLLEDGFLHDVSLLGGHYPILYVSIIKHSSVPFKAKGVIGRNFLIDGRLTLDMQNKLLGFSTKPEHAPGALSADSMLVPINLNRNSDDNRGLLKFFCYINGTKHQAILSTRSSATQISPVLAELLSGKQNAPKITVESLKVGNKLFPNVRCRINKDLLALEPESAEPIDLIFGMDLISQCVLTIDFINSLMLVI